MSAPHHVALHLAHRWFAFLEAPGGDLDAHLLMFHPRIRLSGHRGAHLYAHDRRSLAAWFAAIPDAVSSHHIIHSSYAVAEGGDGLLDMVVAYQSPSAQGMHGAIISYQTRIEFAPDGARFTALDKTPSLGNTRPGYDTSWSANRVLARVHAELGGLAGTDGRLCAALGRDVRQVFAQAAAPEASRAYPAVVTSLDGSPAGMTVVHLKMVDDGAAIMPTIASIRRLAQD